MSSGPINPITPPPRTSPPGSPIESVAAKPPLPPTNSAPAVTAIQPVTSIVSATAGPAVPAPPVRQLSDRPVGELFLIAEEIGLRPRKFKTVQQLITAIHARRQLIATLSRDAMVDVLRWANRSAPPGASKEGLAHQIVTLKSMRFEGLSQRGLVVLAALRGLEVSGDEPVPKLVRRLKKQESFFGKLNRKRRSMLGSIVSNMIGGSVDPAASSAPHEQINGTQEAASAASASIRQEIEESGLFGGLAGRIKKSADGYVNQKLDEIEARIDRKLDEIDRRLAEWRDKEVANRIRILKITLWASVIVGMFSLMYSYVRVYLR